MKPQFQTAVLIGATGLVGKEILKNLLEDPRFSNVLVFSRRSTGMKHLKMTEHLVDFKKINEWKDQIQGDVAFSSLGTTKAQAGSIEAQYEVDYTYQAQFADACAKNGVSTFVLISSMGANPKSRVPYSKMKGELENFVQTLGFENLKILRPGPIEGPREKKRFSEELLVPVSHILSKLPGLGDIHPVHAQKIAETAVASVFLRTKAQILNPQQVRQGATV